MIETHTKLFIDGTGRKPATAATIDVVSPHSEEVIATRARGARGRRRSRRRRGARGVRPRPVAAPAAAERSDAMRAPAGGAAEAQRRDGAATITNEMGSPISFSHMGQVMAANMVLDYFASLARDYAVRGGARRG